MTAVLLYVEHELDDHEMAAALAALASLPGRDGDALVDVTVLVPYRDPHATSLMDDVAAARGAGAGAGTAMADARHEAAVARMVSRRTLEHVLAGLRDAGHACRGEIVPVNDQVRDLVAEATSLQAQAALVVSPRHRIQHLLHRDLESRLRSAGVPWVVHVDEGPSSSGSSSG
jgi:hypothetical protein